MARIHIELPQKFLYETEIPVRATDLNYGGHVGNDTILTLMQEARVLFYRSIGFTSELNLEGDVGQIVTDAALVYKSESFLGDVLIIKLGIIEFNKYGFDIAYLLINKETTKEVARGKTGIVCFDYAKRKVVSVPDTFLKQLQQG